MTLYFFYLILLTVFVYRRATQHIYVPVHVHIITLHAYVRILGIALHFNFILFLIVMI